MKVENPTPFAHAWLVLLNKQAAETLTFCFKATYTISPTGLLEIAAQQDPVRHTDEFYGDPGKSSIRYEAELGPSKPSTDVVMVGHAMALRPGTEKMAVSMRVGPLSKNVMVFGERRWKKGLLGYSASKPLPFKKIALTYENAFGGKDTSAKDAKNHDQEPRNPVGRGFKAKKSDLDFDGKLLPNIEQPDSLMRHPGDNVTPQGFGFIGRDWLPRLKYGGTYDQKWMDDRMPLLPLDFDDRFHNSASPGLVANGYLKGGEVVELMGCCPQPRISFNLPTQKPSAEVLISRNVVPLQLNLNTVLIDTDKLCLNLLWKGDLEIHRRLRNVETIRCRMV